MLLFKNLIKRFIICTCDVKLGNTSDYSAFLRENIHDSYGYLSAMHIAKCNGYKANVRYNKFLNVQM